MKILLGIFLAAAVATSPAAWGAAEDSRAPSELIPDRATVCLELFKPAAIADALLGPAFEARVKSLPGYEGLLSGPKIRELQNAARLFEMTLHTNWQTMVRTLMRQNGALALGEGGRHLVVLTGDDPAMLRNAHDFALQIARSQADQRGQSDQVRSMEYDGLTGWSFNGKEAHVVMGRQLLAASDAAVLKAAVYLRTSKGEGSLAGRADYKAARQAAGPDAAAMLFLDLHQLQAAPWFKGLLEGQQKNPLASLFYADLPARLKAAGWLALGIYLEKGDLVLKAFSDAPTPSGPAAEFAQVKEGERGLSANLTVPRQIAALNVHRDLAAFYGSKDALFPERTSGLIFFENMMGIFFSGRNLTDEVLAELQPQVQLVVARQEYDQRIGVPEPQLPAFALVFELRHPDKFGEVVEEAWQKALGLVNFTRGQKAQPGLILDRAEHHGSRVTLAKFSSKEIEDRSHLDTRFNFCPSLALANNRAILSSTDQLARDLLDAMNTTSAEPGAGRSHTAMRLTGSELARLMRANRMALVRDDMVKKGKTQEESEAGIDIFTALVGSVDQATLTAGGADRGPMVNLRLTFSKP